MFLGLALPVLFENQGSQKRFIRVFFTDTSNSSSPFNHFRLRLRETSHNFVSIPRWVYLPEKGLTIPCTALTHVPSPSEARTCQDLDKAHARTPPVVGV